MLEKEQKLVEEAKRDPEKFAVLYDQFFDQIYRYVYRRVDDKDAVYDLVSQTFCDAYAHIRDFEWRGFSFSSWLYKIAHNNVLKWYRTNNRMQTVELDEGRSIVDQGADQVKLAQNSELKDEVQLILDQLEPEEREIIRLKFFEEVSNIEMAEIMGLSANHIGVKVFRALKKVKSLMNS